MLAITAKDFGGILGKLCWWEGRGFLQRIEINESVYNEVVVNLIKRLAQRNRAGIGPGAQVRVLLGAP